MKSTFRIGRIAGIDIGVHYTWLFAVALISWSLAQGFFPQAYPGWAVQTYWITGILSALLLFLTVLIHELSHSFVARARGLPVEGITLFIFGGVSTLRGEAEKAWDEFAIAIVGPLTSAILAAVFWVIRLPVADASGPLAATLTYLALINGLLAVFNLLPGFPLDGGRVLRSILWGSTGSLVRATNIAGRVGQAVGWVLIALGVLQVLQGNFLSGLWIAFIGWFLNSAAESTRREVATQEIFRGVKVRDMMDPEPEVVSPQTTVESIVRDSFLRRGLRAAPVCEDDQLVGIVTVTDIKEISEEQWPFTVARNIMTREPLHSVSPDEDLATALGLMGEYNIHQVLVTEDGKLEGLLNRAHVVRYLQGVQELGLASASRSGHSPPAR